MHSLPIFLLPFDCKKANEYFPNKIIIIAHKCSNPLYNYTNQFYYSSLVLLMPQWHHIKYNGICVSSIARLHTECVHVCTVQCADFLPSYYLI